MTKPTTSRPAIPRARLDPDKTCKPKTELRGVIMSPGREGTCFVSPAVAHVDLETGRYTWLYELRRAS